MKWLIRIAGAVVVFVIVLVAYVASLDVNQYKDDLIDLVESKTGRKFSIGGDIRLKLSFVPTLTIDGVTFGNAKWAAHKDMVTIERIEARVALIPLLRAELVLRRLAIMGSRISIETDRKGRGNWMLELDSENAESEAPSTLPRFDLHEVEIVETVIEYRGFESDIQKFDIKILQLRQSGFGQPLNLDATVEYDKLRLKVAGDISKIKRLLANEPYAIDLSGNMGEIEFTIKGDLREPLIGREIKIDLNFHSPQLTSLGEPFGIELSSHGPVEFSMTLTDSKKGYDLQNIHFQVDHSTVNGDLKVEPLKERWRMRGNIVASSIDLSDFMSSSKVSATNERLFSEEPLSLDWVRGIDGRLDVSIAHLLSDSVVMSEMSGRLEIDDGTLMIKPLVGKIGDGMFDTTIEIDASAETVHANLDVSITGMSLGSLPKFSRGNHVSGGSTDVKLSIDGAGRSVAAIMASTNGMYAVNIDSATINNEAAGIVSSGLVSMLSRLNPLSSVDSSTVLECASVRFPIVNGEATNETGIGVLTDKLSILGGGTIDLKTEQIDLGAKPKPREGLGINLSSLVDFVRLGGSLSNPRVITDAKGTATAGLKIGAAFATAGLSILAEGMFDRLTADADVCAIARGESSIQNGNDRSGSDQSALESTTSKTKGVLKDAGEKVKGAFKALFGD